MYISLCFRFAIHGSTIGGRFAISRLYPFTDKHNADEPLVVLAACLSLFVRPPSSSPPHHILNALEII